MKKEKWNTLVFICYVAYCVVFYVLYWYCGLSEAAFVCLRTILFMFGAIHTIAQFIAAFRECKHSIGYLASSLPILVLAMGSTWGQGV